MGNGGRRQCQCHAVNSTHRSGHLALDALRVTPHPMRGPVCESPRTRCEVQCMCHPAPRCGVQEKGRRGIHLPVLLDTASQRGMTRWRGPVRPQRERAEQTPPLSGREEANRPRKKGEDCLSTASSAAPEGGDSLRAKKPDNSGGASWFVLLAVEKNEHTGSPRTRCGVQCGASCGYCLCRYSLPGYFWIPHQVRNDGKYRVTARYDVEHRIKYGMTEKKRNI